MIVDAMGDTSGWLPTAPIGRFDGTCEIDRHCGHGMIQVNMGRNDQLAIH